MTDLTAFHEVRFPLAVSFGASGGPERRNEIVLLTSGHEKRNARLAHSRRVYDAGTGIRSLRDLYDVLAFFEARRGSLHGFRFRDPFDMKSCRPEQEPSAFDQAIGIGDGAQRRFQLVKAYGSGGDAYLRIIRKPVPGSVRVAVDGTEASPPSDFETDAESGEIVFAEEAAPAAGAAITAGFEFDVPVRFDTDRLSVSLTSFEAGQVPTVPLIEVLP